MNINNKIIQYLNFKGVSQREFARNMGFAEGILRGSDSLKAKYLKKLQEKYSDLNIDWLLFDKGNMINEMPEGMVNEPQETYSRSKDCEKVEVLQAELIAMQKKLIDVMELNSALQQQVQPLKKDTQKSTVKS